MTFTDDAGNDETLTSAATDAVEARPNSPATGAPDHQRRRAGGPDPDGRHVWNLR